MNQATDVISKSLFLNYRIASSMSPPFLSKELGFNDYSMADYAISDTSFYLHIACLALLSKETMAINLYELMRPNGCYDVGNRSQTQISVFSR